MNTYELARLKYKPLSINFLLVAETPPKTNSNRFFYFENVMEQDSLFIETMKVLYPAMIKNIEIKELRKNKKKFLGKFQSDGFYLIDSLETPFEIKYSSSQKIQLIRAGQVSLLNRIKGLINPKTKVILLSSTVYKANFEYLKQNGINVINEELIDFPGSGGQTKYREKMAKVLNLYNEIN
jgi:hypothetical protein